MLIEVTVATIVSVPLVAAIVTIVLKNKKHRNGYHRIQVDDEYYSELRRIFGVSFV